MPIIKELFFPTPIYYYDIEDSAELNQMLKVRVRSWRERDDKGIKRSNVSSLGAWHSPTTMFQMPEFDFFNQRVIAFMQEVYDDQKFHPDFIPYSQNMWANINPSHGYNRSHTHPGSLWSGVYYVQTPENCGRVLFADPRPRANMMNEQVLTENRGAEYWNEVNHQALAGRIIIFPAWLRHEVEPNMSELPSPDGDRISISFNFSQVQRPVD